MYNGDGGRLTMDIEVSSGEVRTIECSYELYQPERVSVELVHKKRRRIVSHTLQLYYSHELIYDRVVIAESRENSGYIFLTIVMILRLGLQRRASKR
jgi:hypothetical protein